MHPKLGDILQKRDGDKAKVLSVAHDNPDVFLKSEWNDFEITDFWFTTAEAEKLGWKIVGEKWKPEDEEQYWCFDGDLTSGSCTWDNDKIDNDNYAVGNCFPTEEACEEACKKIKEILKGE